MVGVRDIMLRTISAEMILSADVTAKRGGCVSATSEAKSAALYLVLSPTQRGQFHLDPARGKVRHQMSSTFRVTVTQSGGLVLHSGTTSVGSLGRASIKKKRN